MFGATKCDFWRNDQGDIIGRRGLKWIHLRILQRVQSLIPRVFVGGSLHHPR